MSEEVKEAGSPTNVPKGKAGPLDDFASIATIVHQPKTVPVEPKTFISYKTLPGQVCLIDFFSSKIHFE